MTRVQALAVVTLVLLACELAAAGFPTVTHDGRAYVEVFRVAEALRAKLDAGPDRVYLRMTGRVVTLTRNWARVEIDGTPIVLPAPVRVEQGVWLVPEAFVAQVMPKLGASPPASPPAPAPSPTASTPPVTRATPPQVAAKHAPLSPAPALPRVPVAAAPVSPAAPSVPPAVTAPPASPPHRQAPLSGPVTASPPPAKIPEKAPETKPLDVKTLERVAEPRAAQVTTPAQRSERAPDAKLEDIRLRSYPSFTRIVLETSGPVRFRVESPGPKEARIRLTSLAVESRVEPVRDGFVDEVRLERAGADSLVRVAFEGVAGEIKTTTLTDPYRLLLDLARPAERGPRTSREIAPPLRTIVLDAGHGGHDSGAVGPGGLMEKDVAIDVTRRVASLLEARWPGLKVLLSRSGDYFVPLRDRTSFANRERADLFVSIHANAHREVAHEGVEVYFLSSEATDTGARQVAALENGVAQLERVNGRAGSSRTDLVKTILWDLAQSEFQHDSSRLAEVVLESMTRSLRIPNRGVKQAGFYVLGGAAMPAVLVEIGFVTNPREEKKLKDGKYRDEIAKAIVAGLVEYKQNYDQRSRAAAR